MEQSPRVALVRLLEERFHELSGPERRLLERLAEDDDLEEHFTFWDPALVERGTLARDDQEPIRARFLRHLCIGLSKPEIDFHLLMIDGARVVGKLDLHETELNLQIAFRWCVFEDVVDLSHSKIRTISFRGSRLKALYARRTEIVGSLHLNRLGDPFLSDEGNATGTTSGQGCTVSGATILSGATISGNLNCDESMFGVDAPAGSTSYRVGDEPFESFHADGVTVKGHARFRNHCQVFGTLNLRGAKIGRDLILEGVKITTRHRTALAASDVTVKGNIGLRSGKRPALPGVGSVVSGSAEGRPLPELDDRSRKTEIRGVVDLRGAETFGSLDCSGAYLHHGIRDSLRGRDSSSHGRQVARCVWAHGMKVHGSVLMRRGFEAIGEVLILNSHIARDFYCDGGSFDSRGAYALNLDGTVIKGTMFLDRYQAAKSNDFKTNGIVSLVHTTLQQGLMCKNARFTADWGEERRGESGLETDAWFKDGDRGLDLRHARIGGRFHWLEIDSGEAAAADGSAPVVQDSKGEFRLDMYGSTIEVWQLDGTGFPTTPGNLDIRRSDYRALKFSADNDSEPLVFLEQLELHYFRKESRDRNEKTVRFDRRPFMQFAKTLRLQGQTRLANKVSIRQEKGATRFGEYGFFHKYLFRMLILWSFLRYGYHPMMILLPTFAIWIGSALFFHASFRSDEILPLLQFPGSADCIGDEDCSIPSFNAVGFAIDNLLPIVDLRQAEFYQVKGFWNNVVLLFIQIWGWTAGTLIVAGFTGIIRKE